MNLTGPSVVSGPPPLRHAGNVTSVRRTPATRARLAAVLLPVLVVGSLLAGCGNEDDDRPTSEETAVEPNEESPSESSPTPGDGGTSPVPGADSPLVQSSVEDLAEREQVDASEIEVVSVEEVTWRDGSLGCAQDDMMYTQALVDGQRITLRIDGTDYAYHSGNGKQAFYCPEPTQ